MRMDQVIVTRSLSSSSTFQVGQLSLNVADMTKNMNTNGGTHHLESTWHALPSCAARLKELLAVKTAFVPWFRRECRVSELTAAMFDDGVSAGGRGGRHFPQLVLSNYFFILKNNKQLKQHFRKRLFCCEVPEMSCV